MARVDRIVEDSASYAKTIVRGGPVTDGSLASGAFYRPSLIEVEDLSASIIQQEIFGSVATFEVFDDRQGGGVTFRLPLTPGAEAPPDVAGGTPSSGIALPVAARLASGSGGVAPGVG